MQDNETRAPIPGFMLPDPDLLRGDKPVQLVVKFDDPEGAIFAAYDEHIGTNLDTPDAEVFDTIIFEFRTPVAPKSLGGELLPAEALVTLARTITVTCKLWATTNEVYAQVGDRWLNMTWGERSDGSVPDGLESWAEFVALLDERNARLQWPSIVPSVAPLVASDTPTLYTPPPVTTAVEMLPMGDNQKQYDPDPGELIIRSRIPGIDETEAYLDYKNRADPDWPKLSLAEEQQQRALLMEAIMDSLALAPSASLIGYAIFGRVLNAPILDGSEVRIRTSDLLKDDGLNLAPYATRLEQINRYRVVLECLDAMRLNGKRRGANGEVYNTRADRILVYTGDLYPPDQPPLFESIPEFFSVTVPALLYQLKADPRTQKAFQPITSILSLSQRQPAGVFGRIMGFVILHQNRYRARDYGGKPYNLSRRVLLARMPSAELARFLENDHHKRLQGYFTKGLELLRRAGTIRGFSEPPPPPRGRKAAASWLDQWLDQQVQITPAPLAAELADAFKAKARKPKAATTKARAATKGKTPGRKPKGAA